jgi:Na+-transporting NADH:ubiquinone oxidoreductase subunit NqrB
MARPAPSTRASFDPRLWQILSLAVLLGYGMLALGFDQAALAIPLIIVSALATQWVLTRAYALPRFEPSSALITSLSLCLLLRSGELAVLALASVAAIASKFLIRVDGKHVFNPANFAIVVMLLCSGEAWISPAQWGSRTYAVFLFACLAILVLSRARRGDVALAFLGTYVAILLLRALYLGDPLAIPLKQMQSGTLLLFAFFMISDPKTTPDRRAHRIAFGMIVAAAGAFLQYGLWRPEGLMYALFFLSPLVPLLDRIERVEPARRYDWARPTV